ncbi:galactose oxidase [Bradyrhizobium sp. 190]|uniref:Kelch repeat-containing protein n=1 Tax=Bradyrhizobium sp. 190 TaxID=2782658 RepID=UPI001FF79EF6|nr:galactose oxidase [Bradyrhizobium sp. 190]MCK1515001.1 galactose oxidase [Bradyrhizobium sp. 190]
MGLDRRLVLAGGLSAIASATWAQHEHHAGQFERLNQPGRIDLPDLHRQHAVVDSPAPPAAAKGQWRSRAPLPIPRTEMAWATEYRGRVHLVGGYAEQRVDRPYHHAYDPTADKWETLPELPRGANHVGVATLGDRLYAFGGFTEQNRTPHDGVFAFDGARWHSLRRLPEACGAIACVTLGDAIHLVGGAIGSDNRRSVDWHLVYNPREDRYSRRQAMPLGRDHTGAVAVNGVIHLIGGRVDTFHTNSNLHHSYDPKTDEWSFRAPIPTARSGHGTVWLRNRIFCMGGEGTNRVYGQNEAYDPLTDRWESYAPMLTPRHGMGAVVIGDAIYVSGGGPQMGGGVKSAINEEFRIG